MARLSTVCVFVVAILTLVAVRTSADTRTVFLDSEGKIVGAVPTVSDGDSIRICISGGIAKALKVYYRHTTQLDNLVVLDPSSPDVKPLTNYCDPTTKKQNVPDVELIAVNGPGFLLYNVVGPAVRSPTSEELKQLRIKRLTDQNTELGKQKTQAENAKAEVARLTQEIDQLRAGASADATQAIIARQATLASEKVKQKAADDRVKALNSDIEGLLKETSLDAVPPTKAIYRLGALIVGDGRQHVSYRLLRDGSAQQPLRLELVGEYPVLTRGDELFAVVVNAQPSAEPNQFRLTFTSEIAKPPDPAPVRPTVDQSKLGAGPPNRYTVDEELKTASADYLMSFGRPLKPNEVLKATITAYSANITSDKTTVTDGAAKHEVVTETTNVKLIDAVEYPQVHDRYHYNISTGVVTSALRDPVFTKVKSVVGEKETDTRYKVDKQEGDRRVFAVLLFSFYWTPKDVQVPWSAWDLAPVPTVGFSLTSPADNFFAGFQSEIRRNVHLVYGWHIGKVTTLGAVPVDDDRSSAAVNTRKVFDRDGFIGLSFNVNFVKELFK